MIFCTRCGSRSHSAYDCSAPDQNLAPPQETNLPAPVLAPGRPTLASRESGQSGTRESNSVEVRQEQSRGGTLAAGNPLEPPRWPSGPPICERENLPAFPTPAAARAFNRALVEIEHGPWQCEACGLWHYRSRHVGFSTDGSKPSPRLPKGFVPFMRSQRPKARPQGDLPTQARPANKELYTAAPSGLSSGAQAEMKL